ncbi:glycosyltransferase [Haladaptatus sp. DYF46]|uniref:glycosyltransferase n=1 Tax=Haladaptatus sp. DYF46 TaxID=2886041 RepID=UPI001E404A32|nr:glycosyltransferase [Haladaptatus sp. DYF46]
MKVLQLVTGANDSFYSHQIRALEANGIQCTTLTPPGSHTHENTGESRSVANYLRYLPQVLRESSGSYDLLHANYGLTAPFALAQSHLPVVLSLWGSDLFGSYGWLSKLCARRCDAVIVMSTAMADELDQDCYVVPHGVDTEQFRPIPQPDAQAAVGWDPTHLHVFFPYSPSHTVKNYPRAKRIVDAARDRLNRPITLHTISGEPHARMPLHMNAADVLLVTSRWEGSPNSVKEALACNLPIVAVDVGDIRDRITGVSPSYVGTTDTELVNGLVNVLATPRESNGRHAAHAVSRSQMGDRLQQVYETVLSTSHVSSSDVHQAQPPP